MIHRKSYAIQDNYKVGIQECDDIKETWKRHCTFVTKQSPKEKQEKCKNLFRDFLNCSLKHYLNFDEQR